MVYVDDYRGKFGRMTMCHMMADSLEELHKMADRIGVARKWFQDKGGGSAPHYDVCLSKRAAAVKCGAVEVPIADRARWRNVHRIARMRRPSYDPDFCSQYSDGRHSWWRRAYYKEHDQTVFACGCGMLLARRGCVRSEAV